MASGQSIVVGGGIQAGTIALKQVLYVTNVNPPQASGATALTIETDGGNALQFASVPNSAGVRYTTNNVTERLRVNGGAIIAGSGTDSIAIGRGAIASHTDTVCIGRGSGATTLQTTIVGSNSNDNGTACSVFGFGSGALSASGVAIGNAAVISGNAGSARAIAIGDSATAACPSAGGGNSMAIGNLSTAKGQDVVIGDNASSNQASAVGVGNVVIGHGASANVSGGTVNAVVIGLIASTTQKLAVVVGAGSSATAASGETRTVVIGSGSSSSATDAIVIGGGSTITTKSIAIGAAAVDLGAGFVQLGTPGTPATTLVFGAGSTIASPAAKTWRFTNASGTDNAAGDLTIIAPRSTGAATPATIIFQVGAVAGSSPTLQTATTVMTIGDQIVTFAGGISAAGLPTSAGAAGTLWVDTAGGFNIVKRA